MSVESGTDVYTLKNSARCYHQNHILVAHFLSSAYPVQCCNVSKAARHVTAMFQLYVYVYRGLQICTRFTVVLRYISLPCLACQHPANAT
jgi:hypothetical protein